MKKLVWMVLALASLAFPQQVQITDQDVKNTIQLISSELGTTKLQVVALNRRVQELEAEVASCKAALPKAPANPAKPGAK